MTLINSNTVTKVDGHTVVNPAIRINGTDVVPKATPKPKDPTEAAIAELMARLKAMEEQNAALAAQVKAAKSSKRRGLELRVSAKGAVSLYGLGRFPVTEYAEQWERILTEAGGMTQEQYEAGPIGQFIAANRSDLKFKSDEE